MDWGGIPGPEPVPANLAPVDLAIIGVALGDSRPWIAPLVRALRPRSILPSHQDDFFRPIAGGFSFGRAPHLRKPVSGDQLHYGRGTDQPRPCCA